MGASGRKREAAELQKALQNQLRWIERSCEAFDQGDESESTRIATQIRVLCHQTGRSHALLKQMGWLNKIEWVSTAGQFDPRNLSTSCNLVLFHFGGHGVAYTPLCRVPAPPPGREPRTLGFSDWWKEPIGRDARDKVWARSEFVLNLANKEGGAHLDPSPDADYDHLARRNAMAWTARVRAQDKPMGSPVNAAVRQIAYELTTSVNHYAESHQ